jgi:AcrR family transcriptional regulator
MTRIVNSETRSYRSELRAEQARATRDRILEATLRVMARGLASLSIPEVAREAGVSVPTVYRHFGDLDALLDAFWPWFVESLGLSRYASTAEELAATGNTATNPAVSDAFALAIIATGGPPAFPGMPGTGPNLAEARRRAGIINTAMDELLKVVNNPGSYVSESDFFERS